MNTALPKAVQAQLEQAEAIERALAGQATDPGQTDAATDPQPQPQEEPPQVQAEQVVADPQPAAPVETHDNFEQKYKTLEGKYKSEVPQLYQQLRETQQNMQVLQAQLEAAKKPPVETPKPQQLVTDKDREDFGEDMIDMVTRVATAETQKAVAYVLLELDKRLKSTTDQLSAVQQHVERTESETFWDRVAKLVPDWASVDQSPAWVAFLDSTPEFAEESYRSLAMKAIQAGNADKIAALVKTWRGHVEPPAAVQPQESAAQAELRRQVAPSRSSSAAPVPATKALFTGADYQYWNDPRRVRDTPNADLQAKLAELEHAVVENRIQW